MPVTTVQAAEVTRPTTTRLKSSILDHADVKDNVADFGMRSDEGIWLSYNCIDTLVPTPMCPDPPAEKSFGYGMWLPSFTFALYGGVQCKTLGLDVADMKSEIARVFDWNEGKGIERALRENRFVDSGDDRLSMTGRELVWDGAVDLSPKVLSGEAQGEPVDVPLPVALALLESYAADTYAGVPTIHMPRGAATILENQGLIDWTGNKAFTKNGSKVAMGGGYDDQDMIKTGQWDLYATGEVYVEKSDQVSVDTWTGGWDFGPEGETLIDPNSSTSLVERMYRVAIDCFVAKATGKVW